MNEFNLAAIREQYPIVDACVYVNHAAVGPISRTVRQAIIEQADLHLERVGTATQTSLPKYALGRKLAAGLVNGSPEQIAYIQNTSHGISLVANGIDWQEGDNVVLPGLEFPSNYLAWSNLKAKGVEMRHLSSQDGRLTSDDLRQLADRRTRAVSVSHVQFYNGFKCDLAAFGEICRRNDALLVVDGTQSIGAITLDLAATGVDALIVSAHKWMLGPLGIGFMALSPRALNRLSVTIIGWLSVNNPFLFRREVDLLPDARRFEPGTENAPGMYGLVARLRQIEELGAGVIEDRVLTLTDQLCFALSERGFEITSPRAENEKSGIVTFTHEDVASETLYERLSGANVRASLRAGAVRVSPHYYNSEEEIDFVVESLGV